jgi:hypothetical protein
LSDPLPTHPCINAPQSTVIPKESQANVYEILKKFFTAISESWIQLLNRDLSPHRKLKGGAKPPLFILVGKSKNLISGQVQAWFAGLV